MDVPVLMDSIHYAWWSAMVFVVCGMVFVALSVFIPIVTLRSWQLVSEVGLLGQKLSDCVNNSAEGNGSLCGKTIETE
jgi:hypothetical protein